MKRIRDSIRGFVLGVTLTALIVAAPSAMATAMKQTIDVVYNDIKLVVDGRAVTLTDANGNVVEPFIYNGTTYLPVHAAVNAITGGTKAVEWEQETRTIYIGKKPKQAVVSMETLKPVKGDLTFATGGSFTNRQQSYTPYNMFMGTASENNGGSSVYLLNGDFETFSATLSAVDGKGGTWVKLYDGDKGTLLKEIRVNDNEEPVTFSVDVVGIDKLKIQVATAYNNYQTVVYYTPTGALYNATLTSISSGK